jgi:four helix bundle protein
MYSLTNQIQRAAVSIPANIAEGCGKSGDTDFARYLQIAMGSASELEYLLLLSHDLCFVDDVSYRSLMDNLVEVRKMHNVLLQRVRKPS